ncbi:MAG: complex I NDUFA9 subunit family protein [Alphaproteobacteria bacterium]|nr:complex I NDUFA9 subunit family protein [Alphaproteobacteria bacterium]
MAFKRVTVFGGSGFLGRRIVKCLAAEGVGIRVAVRHPERASFLERMGRDGQIERVRADVWEESTVARAVKESTWGINTVGHYVEKGSSTFDAVHGQGALHVARQARQAAVERLIHISGLGADPTSDSPYVRARGIGEVLAKEAFDGLTILRPSVIFGPDDSFFNTLAGIARRTPVLPLFGMGRTNLQPVFVGDVAEACVSVLADPSTEGKAYELGGPRVYTYKALLRLVLRQVDRRRVLVPLPFFLWDTLAALMAFLPDPPLTRDQVKLMKRDNVVEGTTLTLEDLGIGPISVEEILPTYINPNHRNSAS